MAEDANSDELSAFISSTLRAITDGIHGAQGAAKIRSAHGSGVFGFSAPREVEFDIAVSAKKTGTAEGGFKVQVFSIGANAEGLKSAETSSISRIKFTIPSQFKSNRSHDADAEDNWKTI